MKRFTVRKVKQHSYSRQGWILKDLGYVYAIYDREWRKNLEKGYGFTTSRDVEDSYKYIDNSPSKACAEHWAKWLNETKANEYGCHFTIPGKVFAEGLALIGTGK